MGCYYNQYHRRNVYPTGKAGGHQIRCCQGFAVNYYSFTLDTLALKPSGFCNVGVNSLRDFIKRGCAARFLWNS